MAYGDPQCSWVRWGHQATSRYSEATKKNWFANLTGEGRPDVYLGIDAPDFNLGVELALRKAGIPTLRFVSPSIWAWRAGRITKIKQAVERILCIFPFETEIYERAGISATYVGHPLASEIPLEPNPASAKQRIEQALNLPTNALNGIVVSVLPGSRGSEIELIAPVFFETMAELVKRAPGQPLHFVIPVATSRLRAPLEALLKSTLEKNAGLKILLNRWWGGCGPRSCRRCAHCEWHCKPCRLHSGKKPMVISYKVPWLTAQIMKRQGYLPYVGLPNILCGEFVVPELLQNDATPSKLADALLSWLNNPSKVTQLKTRFAEMHETLRRPTGLLVAQAVAQTIAAN